MFFPYYQIDNFRRSEILAMRPFFRLVVCRLSKYKVNETNDHNSFNLYI